MTKFFALILVICSTLSACGPPSGGSLMEDFIIDPSIKGIVEKSVRESEFENREGDMLIYENRILGDFYEADTLSASSKEQDNQSTIFRSIYHWQNDTICIDGMFGLFGGIGFSLKIHKGKAALYHLLASDEFPSYAYHEKDSLISRLEVPCTDNKIILSELPDVVKKPIIYGYVEFKSGNYYASSGAVNGQEILPRKKQRANMRIYFKSAHFNL